jgi:hypothetical protein
MLVVMFVRPSAPKVCIWRRPARVGTGFVNPVLGRDQPTAAGDATGCRSSRDSQPLPPSVVGGQILEASTGLLDRGWQARTNRREGVGHNKVGP